MINGKVYIGQTIRTLEKRWKQHCYSKGCKNISNAIQKYGKENFTLEQIIQCDSIKALNCWEKYYIGKYDSLSPIGYNLTTGGLNKIYSEETKQKMSSTRKGTISHQRKPIVCLQNGIVYHSIAETAKQLKVKSSEIQRVLKKTRIHTRGYSFDYFVEGMEIITQDKIKSQGFCNKILEKKVLCVELNIIFDSQRKAAKYFEVSSQSIFSAIHNKNRSKKCKGYTFKLIEETNGDSNNESIDRLYS